MMRGYMLFSFTTVVTFLVLGVHATMIPRGAHVTNVSPDLGCPHLAGCKIMTCISVNRTGQR
jgi:hypothetical protein